MIHVKGKNLFPSIALAKDRRFEIVGLSFCLYLCEFHWEGLNGDHTVFYTVRSHFIECLVKRFHREATKDVLVRIATRVGSI